MTTQISLSLLGPPQLLFNGDSLGQSITRKAQAILIYLVMNPGTHRREALAGLLWSEMNDVRARNNLRTVLHELRPLRDTHLTITRHTVTFDPTSNYWLDVEVIHQQLTEYGFKQNLKKLTEILTLQRGEFLESFYVQNAAVFEDWVLQQREYIRTQLLETMEIFIQQALVQGDYLSGLTVGRQLLLLEPFRESAHQTQMQLLLYCGRRSEALAQYEICQQILADEFGIEPSWQTQKLRDSIQQGGYVLAPSASHEATMQSSPNPEYSKHTKDKVNALTTDRFSETPSSKVDPISVGLTPPTTGCFYGRDQELTILRKWLLQERCHVVAILGMGGQGKTTLAATFVHTLTPNEFDTVIWRSLLNAPPLSEILQTWLQALGGQTIAALPTSLDQQFDLLLEYLNQQRCLLILDNVESILQRGTRAGSYRPGYEVYGQLLAHIGQHSHQSALLLTSRERPQSMAQLARTTEFVRSHVLTGLPLVTGFELLAEHNLVGTLTAQKQLIQRYNGNPLALVFAAATIEEIYNGHIQTFLDEKIVIFDDIRNILDQQFERLSPVERQVLFWLTVEREPASLSMLCTNLFQARPNKVLEAVTSLQHRFLIEHQSTGFTLQNVVMEYLTDHLVEAIVHEVTSSSLEHSVSEVQRTFFSWLRTSYFNLFPLLKAQSNQYVRQSQTRMLLQPVVAGLQVHWGKDVVAQLTQLLNRLQTTAANLPGYAAANLLHLLSSLEVDLRGYDFSHLALWQAYLCQMHIPQVNLTGADLSGSVFLESFGGVTSLALSPDGKLLAIGSNQGDVTLWHMSDQQMVQQFQVHTLPITSLSFSPDGRRLATAGYAPMIIVWDLIDLDRGLWQITKAYTMMMEVPFLGGHVVFHPDGNRLAASGVDGRIHIWDCSTGECLHILQGHQQQMVYSLAFSPDGTMLASGVLTFAAKDGGDEQVTLRLWHVTDKQITPAMELSNAPLTFFSIVFSPDGRLLISGSDDWIARIWDVTTGHLCLSLDDGASTIFVTAVAPDGTLVATGHHDGTVRLWDTQSGALIRLLSGHTDNTWGLVFSPDSQMLISGGADRVVRLWHAQTGQLVDTFTGHSNTIYTLALSDDGQLLASGGADGFVYLWSRCEQGGYEQTALFEGHTDRVMTIALHPMAPLLASAGDDRMIRIWEIRAGKKSKQPVQILHGHNGTIRKVVFHPNGQFLVSCGSDRTICLWDLASGHLVQTLCEHARTIYSVTFSPDGQYLVSVDAYGNILIWQWQSGVNGNTNNGPLHLVKRIRHPGVALTETVFIPNDTIYAASIGPDIYLYDERWEVSDVLTGHTGSYVWGLCRSADGRILVSGGEDMYVRVWDLGERCQIAQFAGHEGIILAADISSDGSHIYTGSQDGTLKIWETASGTCLQTLCPEFPYAGMNITGITGVTDVRKASLKALGAVENTDVERHVVSAYD